MANLKESALKEALRSNKLPSVCVLVAEDPFKPDFYASAIRRKLFPEHKSDACEVLYGDELKPYELIDNARTVSLWDPEKFLHIRQAERISAKQWEALLPLIKEPLEKCTVVFQAAKADGRMKFFQALGKAGAHAALVKFDSAKDGEWSNWLQEFLREEGKRIDPEARRILQEWTTGALYDLRHTVERAALYAGGAEEITVNHVRAVGFRVAPESVFAFSEVLLAGDKVRSLELLQELLQQGEEPIALVGLLARQYRWLLGILSMRAENKADNAIASAFGIFPAAGKVLFPAARRLGGKGVLRGLARLAEADLALKSSKLPAKHIMSRLVLQLLE